MARAETISKMTIVGISLELSLQEADVLAAILRNVEGKPTTTSYKKAKAILEALYYQGVHGGPEENVALGIHGTIRCD